MGKTAIELKQQTSECKSKSYSTQGKKTHQSNSNLRTMLVGLFDYQSMVHYEFIPQGQTMNLEFWVYYGFFEKKFKTNNWNFGSNTFSFFTMALLLHILCQKFHKKQNSLVPQPLHSSDPCPVDFLLFPKLNVMFKWMSVWIIIWSTRKTCSYANQHFWKLCMDCWGNGIIIGIILHRRDLLEGDCVS